MNNNTKNFLSIEWCIVIIILFIILLFCPIGPFGSREKFCDNNKSTYRYGYFDNVHTKTSKSKCIVVMLFYTDWCGYSKMFLPTWEKLCKHFKKSKDVKLVKINGDKNESMVDHYYVRGYPTIIIKTKKGNLNYEANRDFESMKKYINLLIKNNK